MDEAKINEAVEELARMLRADGGDLLLVDANPKTARIKLQLVLDDVSCEDCVLPPDMLFETVQRVAATSRAGRVRAVARRSAPRRRLAT